MMSSKKLMKATMKGKKTERVPVCIFFNCDYKARNAGIHVAEFLYGGSEFRIKAIEQLYLRHREDWIHCDPGVSKTWTENHHLVREKDDWFVVSKKTGQKYRLREDLTIPAEEWQSEFLPGGSVGYSFAEIITPRAQIRSAAEARKKIRVKKERELVEEGYFEPQIAMNKKYGKDAFIACFAGNLAFNSVYFFGIEDGLVAINEYPELFRELVRINLEQEIETVRAGARNGADGIWITEMLASADIVSPTTYRDWIFPAQRELISEIHALGMKAILFFCGDVTPLLESIIETGVDALAIETQDRLGNPMDIGVFRQMAGDRITLFGNIDPIYMLIKRSDEEIRQEIRRQINVAGKNGRFVLHSNIVPVTVPPEKVDLMIEAAKG